MHEHLNRICFEFTLVNDCRNHQVQIQMRVALLSDTKRYKENIPGTTPLLSFRALFQSKLLKIKPKEFGLAEIIDRPRSV